MSGFIEPNRPVSVGGREHAYDGVARAFHWTIVALLVVQYFTEWAPKSLGGGSDTLTNWHLAVGPTILLLMLLRLLWRLTHRPPPPPADLPVALRLLSRATHYAFYAILIVLPLLGWTAASGFGAPAYLLGFIPLPALISKNKPLADIVGDVHGTLALALLAVIALHVAGALYHGLVKRDGVVQRMLPFGAIADPKPTQGITGPR